LPVQSVSAYALPNISFTKLTSLDQRVLLNPCTDGAADGADGAAGAADGADGAAAAQYDIQFASP